MDQLWCGAQSLRRMLTRELVRLIQPMHFEGFRSEQGCASAGPVAGRTPTKPNLQSLWTSAVEGRDADEQIERPAQVHPTIETGQSVLLAKNAIDVTVVGDYPVGPDEARIPGHHVTRPTLT